MKPQNSILSNFLFCSFYILVGWFLIIAPYSKVKSIINQTPNWIKSTLIEKFPADLNIAVKNGTVSLNRTSPYCLIIPFNQTASQLPPGIVIDVNAKPDISVLESNGIYSKLCQPLGLVGKNFVFYPDQNSTYKYTKISPDLNLEINQSTITGFSAQILPIIVAFGQKAYFILPIVAVLFLFLWFLSNNYWYAFIVWLINKIFKIKPSISFNDLFRLSLFFYNIVLFIEIVLVNYLLNFVLHQQVNLSFFFRNTLVITLASIIYLQYTRPKETPVPHPIATPTI